MSGGVDSSVVAALLNAEGHEVIGITLQLYDHGVALEKKGACCAGQDIYDAQVAAEQIGIPHYVLNYESIFKQSVMDDFANSYLRGETPIPCVLCNQKVKFRDLFKVAQDLGAEALATGHYVQKIFAEGRNQLHKGVDTSKDQSYFLFTTTQQQLDYLLFPLGAMTKDETRKLAAKFNLNIAAKPDSQDICFVPDGNYNKVIARLRPDALTKGDIVYKDGKILGEHNGIINFTIGQRRGIGVAHPTPLYVIKIDPESRQVIVGEKEDLAAQCLRITAVNWLDDKIERLNEVTVKLRSAHSGIEAELEFDEEMKHASVKLLDVYEGITPGQACVIYKGSRMLGGGWIMRDQN